MKILGTLTYEDGFPVINPYVGNSLIEVKRLYCNINEMSYYRVICDTHVENMDRYGSVYVMQSNMKVSYCSWSTSLHNPYILMDYTLAETIKSVKTMNEISSKYLSDIATNSHFAILHEGHMLRAFARLMQEEFPALTFDATPARVRVNNNWVTL